MNKVLNTYDQFFADPNERHAYLKREIARMDYEQGMKSNFAKGKEEATEEHALAFIKAGFSKDTVFKTLNMSKGSIDNFLRKYKDVLI